MTLSQHSDDNASLIINTYLSFFARNLCLLHFYPKDKVDSVLPLTMASLFANAARGLGIIVLTAYAVPPFLIFLPLVLYSFWSITKRYLTRAFDVEFNIFSLILLFAFLTRALRSRNQTAKRNWKNGEDISQSVKHYRITLLLLYNGFGTHSVLLSV